jgi:3D (Asp-Asp-Asp) domain-containing protein
MFGFGVITLGAIGVLADNSEEPNKTIHQYSKVGYTNTGLEFIEKNGKHVSTGELSDTEFRKIMKQKDIELAELEEKRKLELAYKKHFEEKSKVTKQAVKEVNINLSHYTAKCYKCSGITKTGYDVRNTIYYKGYRIIATDPKVIPLYSIVEIETKQGIIKAVSLDTGGRILKNHVDFLVGTKEEAYALGRYNTKLRIIGSIKETK